MSEKVSFIEPLFDKFEEYSKTSIDLFRLEAIDKIATYSSLFVFRCILFFFVLIVVFVTNIGASLWIGELLGKPYYGFFCVACFYTLAIGFIYFFMRKWIKKYVGNSIVSEILK